MLLMTREQKLISLLAQFKELGIDRQVDYDRWQEVGLSIQVQFVKRDFIPTEKGDVGINVGINEQLVGLLRQTNRLFAKELAKTPLKINSKRCMIN